VRRAHFEAIAPVCAVCLQAGAESPLRIGRVEREQDGDVLEGILQCGESGCQREYPILDGVPILVPALRAYVSQNILPILRRSDLSDTMESILGDCCGHGSAFDQMRQHLSTYGWGHYSDLDPLETGNPPLSLLGLLDQGLALAGPPGEGPILDAGCSVGRSTFALAERHERLVLGVDLSFSMLQVASRALRTGEVRYPRRRVGLVYDERSFPVRLRGSERVDFWVCDAAALPFPRRTFSLASSLNLLDCLPVPHEHLRSLARVLRPGARAVLATPHDWSTAATPIEGWIGGHSQRGPEGGSSSLALRALLTPGAHPASVEGLSMIAASEAIPWLLRLHERSVVQYASQLVVAERLAEGQPRLAEGQPRLAEGQP
jgi:SAM-dependent methyltransferase/uncharacterized protein YbaR (Trm112 family)